MRGTPARLAPRAPGIGVTSGRCIAATVQQLRQQGWHTRLLPELTVVKLAPVPAHDQGSAEAPVPERGCIGDSTSQLQPALRATTLLGTVQEPGSCMLQGRLCLRLRGSGRNAARGKCSHCIMIFPGSWGESEPGAAGRFAPSPAAPVPPGEPRPFTPGPVPLPRAAAARRSLRLPGELRHRSGRNSRCLLRAATINPGCPIKLQRQSTG